ncbi:MAG: TolC family protein, partial [Rubripirellula sp.]
MMTSVRKIVTLTIIVVVAVSTFHSELLFGQLSDGRTWRRQQLGIEHNPVIASLQIFAQQEIPRLVHQSKQEGWQSNLILDVFESRLRYSIKIHEEAPNYSKFETAIDNYLLQLRSITDLSETEIARRSLLLANDGILLTQVKNSLVKRIAGQPFQQVNHQMPDEGRLARPFPRSESDAGKSQENQSELVRKTLPQQPQMHIGGVSGETRTVQEKNLDARERNDQPPAQYSELQIPRSLPAVALPATPFTIPKDGGEVSSDSVLRPDAGVGLNSSKNNPAYSEASRVRTESQIAADAAELFGLSVPTQSVPDTANDMVESTVDVLVKDVQRSTPVPDVSTQIGRILSPSDGLIAGGIQTGSDMSLGKARPDRSGPLPNLVTPMDQIQDADESILQIPSPAMGTGVMEPGFDLDLLQPNRMRSALEGPFYSSQLISRASKAEKSRFRLFSFSWFRGQETFPSVDGDELLEPYRARAKTYVAESKQLGFTPQSSIPGNYRAWWHEPVTKIMHSSAVRPCPVDLESLVLYALQYSPQIASLRIDPSVSESTIIEEDAEFDWMAFVEASYDRLNEPWYWNSILPGGNVPGTIVGADGIRLRSDELNARGGMRRVLREGSEIEVYQDFTTLSNNQQFLNPNPANLARLELSLKKPLLKGNGVAVNQSRIVIAELNRDISGNDSRARIEEHIRGIHSAYWTLYLERARLLQKRRLLERSERILEILNARQNIDATQSQIMRTRSVVAKRRAEIPRLTSAVRNAQADLRLLVNSPALKKNLNTELLPYDAPSVSPLPVSMQASLQTALTQRPDIAAAMTHIHRTGVHLEVSKNELLPRFDLDFRMYTAGIQSSNRFAFADQFSSGGPGVGVGVILELPIGNRKANAARDRRELLLTKAFKDFEVVVESALVESEQAVRDIEASYIEMLASYDSMNQATAETTYTETRWRTVTVDGTSMQLLDALFDSQDRTAEEEFQFVASQVRYELA